MFAQNSMATTQVQGGSGETLGLSNYQYQQLREEKGKDLQRKQRRGGIVLISGYLLSRWKIDLLL